MACPFSSIGDHRGHGLTAKTPADLGFFASRDGWRHCLDDLKRLREKIAAEHEGLPIVLMGHSLGSFMVQQYRNSGWARPTHF